VGAVVDDEVDRLLAERLLGDLASLAVSPWSTPPYMTTESLSPRRVR
jgi:hypothetical protein